MGKNINANWDKKNYESKFDSLNIKKRPNA